MENTPQPLLSEVNSGTKPVSEPLLDKCLNLPSDIFPPSGGAGNAILATNSRSTSIPASSFILPNGIETYCRPIAALDWSRNEITVFVKGQKIKTYSSLSQAAPFYNGYIWVLESTADSFELQNRKIDIDAIKTHNIVAYCFHPKYTARYRNVWKVKKTDKADAKVIYRIFTKTKLNCHLFRELIDETQDTLRKKCKDPLVNDRYEHSNEESYKVASNYLPNQDLIPKNYHEYLYEPAGLKKKAKKYKPRAPIGKLLMVAKIVKSENRGFREFRRQIGNYGLGYGCIARSEFYHHICKSVIKARLKKAGIALTELETGRDSKTGEVTTAKVFAKAKEIKIKKKVLKEMSSILKFLWHLV